MANKKISELDPAGAIVGTEMVELVQSGASVRSTVDGIKNGAVKVYRALITQSGTDNPVPTVLENTLGGTLVWTYNNTGQYLGTLEGAFPSAKCWFSPFSITTGAGSPIDFHRVNDNAVEIISNEDGNVSGLPIEIRVYP